MCVSNLSKDSELDIQTCTETHWLCSESFSNHYALPDGEVISATAEFRLSPIVPKVYSIMHLKKKRTVGGRGEGEKPQKWPSPLFVFIFLLLFNITEGPPADVDVLS